MNWVSEALYYAAPVWLQNLAVSAYGLHLYRKRYTSIYPKLRAEIDEYKSLTQAEIHQRQSERLHELIKFCVAHVPYYRKVLSDYGYTPADFTSTDDLVKLPILDKTTVNREKAALRAKNAKIWAIQKTSGSTGTPLAVNVDERTYKLTMALLVDHEESHGVQFGARRATFAGRLIKRMHDFRPPFARLNRAENQLLFSSYHISDRTIMAYADELNRFDPEEIIGYPSAIYELARLYDKYRPPRRFQPKAVVTNSETLLQWQREMIETVFDCPVYDYYGTAECVVFAGQDNSGDYLVSPVLGIAEVVGGEAVSSADEGCLVATTLTNYAMPLIRYRVGDRVARARRASEASAQISGFGHVEGRADDYIVTPDGRRIGRIDHIFKGLGGIAEAQVVQDRPDRLTINVVRSGDDEIEQDRLLKNVSERVGQMNVNLVYTSRIPRGANGKFRAVVNTIAEKSVS